MSEVPERISFAMPTDLNPDDRVRHEWWAHDPSEGEAHWADGTVTPATISAYADIVGDTTIVFSWKGKQ